MAYMSDLMGKPVADVDGEYVGYLEDLVATVRGDKPHPTVIALAVKRSSGLVLIPFSDVVVLVAPAIPLSKRIQDILAYQPGEHDLFLARDVLDKQIIDTDGVRVVRVNDLELMRVNGNFYVANVDVGGMGLLRRLGLAKTTQSLVGRFARSRSANMISWEEVELLPGNQPMRLRVPGKKIAELHPADLAEIISDLNRSESGRLLETLDAKTVADTLEEVEPDFQASLVETMPDEKVADVLEEMSPDEAADLLAELPEERSEDLLNLMERRGGRGCSQAVDLPGQLGRRHYDDRVRRRQPGPDRRRDARRFAPDGPGCREHVLRLRDRRAPSICWACSHSRTWCWPTRHIRDRVHARARRHGQSAGQPGRRGPSGLEIQPGGAAGGGQ